MDGGIINTILVEGFGSIVDLFTSFVDLIVGISDFIQQTMDIVLLDSGGKLFDLICETAETLIGTSSSYQGSIAYQVYVAMIPLGAILMMIFFGMKLSDLVINEEVTVESMAKLFGYMVLMLMLLDNGYGLMMKCYDLICTKDSPIISSLTSTINSEFKSNFLFNAGNISDFAGELPSNIAEIPNFLKRVANAVNRLPFMVLSPLLSFIPALILRTSFMVAISIRAIKLAVHMSFAPIAFASCFDDNISTTKAMNHFKKILSLFLQGPLILIMMKITSYAISSSQDGHFSPVIALFFACVMMKRAIKGSEQRADQMLGVS